MAWKRGVLAIGVFCGVAFAAYRAEGQLASVENGRYRHFKTDVEFAVPPGWSVVGTGQSSDGGEQMYLRDAASPSTYVAVWMKREANTPAEADAWLELAVKMKVDQRGGAATGYRFRPDTIEHLYVRDHKAVKAVADLPPGTRSITEYFTWIYTERTRVQFDVRGIEPEASSTASRLEEIIQTATIP